MAVKTITIDLEAYETLSRLKREGQSFSDVIKLRLGRRHRAADLLAKLDALGWSEETADAVTQQVARRSRHRTRVPKL